MQKNIVQALRQGLIDEMERDSRIVLLGEDIGVFGGAVVAPRLSKDGTGGKADGWAAGGGVASSFLSLPHPIPSTRTVTIDNATIVLKAIVLLLKIVTCHFLDRLTVLPLEADL